MKNSQKNLLAIRKRNSIIEYVKQIIKKLFSKEEKVEIEGFSEDIQKDFHEKIKYVDEYEKEKILKAKIERNEIKISDLTNLEKEKMIEFYRNQINLKKNKLEEIKMRIWNLKHIEK